VFFVAFPKEINNIKVNFTFAYDMKQKQELRPVGSHKYLLFYQVELR